MVQIGKINRLTIKSIQGYGVHLDGGEAGDVVLAKKEAPVQCQSGDELEVFVYFDREKSLRATTKKPYVTVGNFACLQMVANSPAGAYMDWGLQRDLLIPKREQHSTLEEGKSYVVFAFFDEQGKRITGSTKLDKFLDLQSPTYSEGEEVELIICDQTDLGYKAVVNNCHWGMIYKNEVFQDLHIGQRTKGYIKKIREDFKIDLSLQPSGYQKIDGVSLSVLNKLEELGGGIGITDKSPPEEIYSLFGVSKKVFKKAIGALYKKRLITIDHGGIKLVR